MKQVAIIGGGISGLSMAHFLRAAKFKVKVYEKESRPGGLIRCERIKGSLFHLCGGHVFNTKNKAVADWFWSKFNQGRDFLKAVRRSAVCLGDGRFVDYPLENHVYQLGRDVQQKFYADVNEMLRGRKSPPANFDEFLRMTFGETLYDLYFKPYNEKIWRRDLRSVPLSWLEGKLPMPTPQEMLDANREHLDEKDFVHSTFYYEKFGGSQFLADELAKPIDIAYNTSVVGIESDVGCSARLFFSDGTSGLFDYVVFCGNLRNLPAMVVNGIPDSFLRDIEALEYHGTTAVFCETDQIPYSWFYQPSSEHQSHRMICTGNFSPSNNAPGKMTCTVEFTDEIRVDDIVEQLRLMPYHPRYLAHHFEKYTYPIQHASTRQLVRDLADWMEKRRVFLVGRFAEWEYYNMDAAIGSAMRTARRMEVMYAD